MRRVIRSFLPSVTSAQRARARSLAGTAAALLPLMFGCDCDNQDFAPQGAIEPAVLDLGPVLDGDSCEAVLTITNLGGSELSINGAEMRELNGDFTFQPLVSSVGIGGEEPLRVDYTASGTEGNRESTTVVLLTNDPDDDGEITAVITAIATDEAGAIAGLRCPNEAADGFEACGAELNLGAVNIQDPIVPIDQRAGFSMEVVVRNTGNADMELQAVALNDGNPDFTIQSIQQGNVLVEQLPITLEAGAGACGAANPDAQNEARITVFYSPTALGADADTLVVLTSAIEGSRLELPVTGVGSDIGILLTPPTVVFDDIAEGETDTADIIVSNLGTNQAPVNSTCIDLEGDGACSFDCTGGDPGLGDTLNCEVFKDDDSHEGKGFILEPTDAQAGGDDQRRVTVTWSPTAANPSIPSTAVVRFETGILNDKVWTAPIFGGAAGNLTFDDLGNGCGNGICVSAEGDSADVGTWTGEVDFTLGNDGDATVTLQSFAWEGPPTIADDYELYLGDTPVTLEAPGVDIAPGGSETFTIVYTNNDASGADAINLVITHTGANLTDTVPVNVTPPPEQ